MDLERGLSPSRRIPHGYLDPIRPAEWEPSREPSAGDVGIHGALLHRSIPVVYQASSHGQPHRPTVGISFASRCMRSLVRVVLAVLGPRSAAGLALTVVVAARLVLQHPDPVIDPRRGLPATGMSARGTTLLPGSSVNRKCRLVIADHPIGVSSSQSATGLVRIPIHGGPSFGDVTTGTACRSGRGA